MGLEETRELADQLRSWAGDPAGALELRERVRRLESARGAGTDDAERAVIIARNLLLGGKNRGENVADRYFRRAGIGMYLAPFLGAEPEGSASYHDPLTVDVDDALFWLDYMRKHLIVPDLRMRAFVREMLHVRPRALWVPAADAFVRMARADPGVEEELLDLCKRFPQKNGRDRAPSAEGLDDLALRKRALHMRRHVRYVAARWRAAGGDSGKLPEDLRKVPNFAPPRDATAFSIEVLCLAARLHSASERAQFLLQIPTFIEKTVRQDAVTDDAFRHLFEVLQRLPDTRDELQAVAEHLLEPAWLARCTPSGSSTDPGGFSGSAPELPSPRVDAVLSWLDSIDLIRRYRSDVIETLSKRYPRARTVLDLRFAPLTIADPVKLLTDRLAVVFDLDVYNTTPEIERALLIAETFELFKHPEVHRLPWPPLLRRAAGREQAELAHDGSVGEVAMADLLVRLAGSSAQAVLRRERGIREQARQEHDEEDEPFDLPTYLLRRLVCAPEPLPEQAIVCLAAVKLESDDVSIQVALHVERHLRRLHGDPAGQLRLVWKILEVDPTTKFLTELYSVLPGLDSPTDRGPEENQRGTPLHQVVDAIRRMDDARNGRDTAPRSCAASSIEECKARVYELVQLYRMLTAAALKHLHRGGHDEPRHTASRGTPTIEAEALLELLSQSFVALNAQLHRSSTCADAGLLDVLEHAINGGDSRTGLAAWLTWIDHAPPELVERFNEVEGALRPLLSRPHDVTDQGLGQAEQSLSCLAGELNGCPWPEREILDCAIAHLRGWLQERRRELAERASIAAQVERWLQNRDFEALASQIANEPQQVSRFEALPVEVLHAAHAVLLEHDQVEAADRLGRRLRPHVRLQHYLAQRRPERVVKEVEALSDEDIRNVPPQVQLRVHEFLLERLYLRLARNFRRRVAAGASRTETVRLRHETLYFGPLLVGILVGAFLMVDFGNSWNSLLKPGNWPLFLWTIGFALILAAVILIAATLRRTAGDVGSRAAWVGLIWRAVLVCGAALCVALTCASGLLLSLAGSDAARPPSDVEASLPVRALQVVLWGSLSLFLGVVLGVLGQGRGVYETRSTGSGDE